MEMPVHGAERLQELIDNPTPEFTAFLNEFKIEMINIHMPEESEGKANGDS